MTTFLLYIYIFVIFEESFGYVHLPHENPEYAPAAGISIALQLVHGVLSGTTLEKDEKMVRPGLRENDYIIHVW